MSLTAINAWTGVPLLGLWAGAQVVSSSGQLSLLAVGVVVAVIFIGGLACARLLTVLSQFHDRLSGRTRTGRRHAPWLRPLSGERSHATDQGAQLSAVDYVVVITVVLCVIAFEAWFFLVAGSPIGGSSAR